MFVRALLNADFSPLKNTATLSLYACALFAAAAFVHSAKMLRMYAILSGQGYGLLRHVRFYCMSTAVTIALPLKAGELFRVWLYGRHNGQFLRALCMVALDRFFDTAALCAIILLCQWYFGFTVKSAPVFYLLTAFLFVAAATFVLLGGMLSYWRRYFLTQEGSERNLRALRAIAYMQKMQGQIRALLRGRSFLLLLLSLVAWAGELGFLCAANKLLFKDQSKRIVLEYLNAALFGTPCAYLSFFSAASCAILAVTLLATLLARRGTAAHRRRP